MSRPRLKTPWSGNRRFRPRIPRPRHGRQVCRGGSGCRGMSGLTRRRRLGVHGIARNAMGAPRPAAGGVIIQPWRAVDPGQGCECLVAGGSECAAGIVIPAADDDVGGVDARGIILARLARLVRTVHGPGMICPPATAWVFSLPAISTGGAQTCCLNRRRNKMRRKRQWKTSGYRERLARSSAVCEAAAAPRRHAVCVGGLQLPGHDQSSASSWALARRRAKLAKRAPLASVASSPVS